MAISHVDTTTGTGAASGTLSITVPATASAGTLIVLTAKQHATASPTWTYPSGYTQVATARAQASSSVSGIMGIGYKLSAGAADQGAKSITSTNSAGSWGYSISVYSGVDQTTPVVATGSSSTGTMSTSTMTINAITMTAANSWLYSAYFDNLTGAPPHFTPDFSTERSDFLDTTGFGSADEAIAAAGSTGTRTITNSGFTASWGTVAIGINEGAAGAAAKPRLIMPPTINQFY